MLDTIRQPATTEVLSQVDVAQHHRDGFSFPIRIMPEADAADCERKLCARWKPVKAAQFGAAPT